MLVVVAVLLGRVQVFDGCDLADDGVELGADFLSVGVGAFFDEDTDLAVEADADAKRVMGFLLR